MHPIEFLHWLLGAIKLGKLVEVKKNSELCEMIKGHIEAVYPYHQLELIDDNNHKAKIKEMLALIEVINHAFSNDCTQEQLKAMTVSIEEVTYGFYYPKLTQFLYFLQGAFELAKWDLIDFDQITITEQSIAQYNQDHRYKKEINFYFMLIADPLDPNSNQISGIAKHNLKTRVDSMLRKAC